MPWDFRDFPRQIKAWPQHQTFLVQLCEGRDGAHKLIVFPPGGQSHPECHPALVLACTCCAC